MIAILGWCDGFGNDTYVAAIVKTQADAIAWVAENVPTYYHYPLRWTEFNFGKVDFDYYEAQKFPKGTQKQE